MYLQTMLNLISAGWWNALKVCGNLDLATVKLTASCVEKSFDSTTDLNEDVSSVPK